MPHPPESNDDANRPARPDSQDTSAELAAALDQSQFLDVVDPETASTRWHAALDLEPLHSERIAVSDALQRVLARDVTAAIDVTTFDRSNVDGFAVRAEDTVGATEIAPVELTLNPEILVPGRPPTRRVMPGTATPIATGGMVPRGADASVMIEHTRTSGHNTQLEVRNSVVPGQSITFAGTDIARGETVLRAGQPISSREIGVLAALGQIEVAVRRRPRVAIISTGSEIIAPGSSLPDACVFDSNSAILAAAVRELGAEPCNLGVVADDPAQLQQLLATALDCDLVILSGGTSKGAGDISYRVVAEHTDPGVIVHGVALKPGKPLCLAAHHRKPVVVLPGFPTSAIFTFHEFVAPVIRRLLGRPDRRRQTLMARLPHRINSDRGRTEFLLVGLVRAGDDFVAYPLGKGSGSVTTFSLADGFVTIDQHTEILEAGQRVAVQLLGATVEPADLVFIGSHCVGLDVLISELLGMGFTAKAIHVGSTGGLSAAARGECDVAGVHLLDPETNVYNRGFLDEGMLLVEGYLRRQGIVYRPHDAMFTGQTIEQALDSAAANDDCVMINRNAGSGTRILIDRLLRDRRPAGYSVQARSHNAVAAAVKQQRADWGVAIESVAREYELEFLPIGPEQYDFVIPAARREKPAVQAFVELLSDPGMRSRLSACGLQPVAQPSTSEKS